MFADIALAARIESTEARFMREIALAIKPKGGFARELAGGVAVFNRPGSPMNKFIGLGFDGELEGAALAEIERAYFERKEPVRVELSTLAPGQHATFLTGRGYRLLGFENVLGRTLTDLSEGPREIPIRTVSAGEVEGWEEVIVDGFAAPDETGVVVDSFTRDVIQAAIADMREVTGCDRYLAMQGDTPAGAASMRLDHTVVLLTGAGTLPAFRRRGVQRALLARRLSDARARGAELAVITTGGGTRSQANAMRSGFSLLYARAILEKLPA